MNEELREVLREFEDLCLSSAGREAFVKAFHRISSRYRKQEGHFLQTKEERWAYIFTRFPGTYASIQKVCSELAKRAPHLSYTSLLDLGAGPGTGMWAVSSLFPNVSQYTLVERDRQFLEIGKQIAQRSSSLEIQKAKFLVGNLEASLDVDPHDLVLFSYSFGELKEDVGISLLSRCWDKVKKTLILIEPGTPVGYQRLIRARKALLELGGVLWAPCPHSGPCPLLEGDWCHFSVRVARSSLHRQLKTGELGYEDEKFFYLIFGKEPLSAFQGRILRHPGKHSGHLELTVCREGGVQREVYTKRDPELYKAMKKKEWGDFF